ncbi:MFS general substrate transporter [Stereum hirsutum FP-91666 SS1]|uniref:MFS general substrate transporter n=1 Tax=Stereum hirsutum (strain FP-91666) TaxID=721885 RepID=UPI000440E9CA|nr:MFS general substrate transporter [Stereum hirsutum FP-91666 SS1]EIM88160.1 MFS general substrate transporter [Stereum hirsutum FP-91666 SS1]
MSLPEPKGEADYCDNASGSGREESIEQKLDKNGLPLVPQPSSDPSDPLNFPQWLKVVILIQASVMALLGPFNTAVINPALVPLGEHFDVSTVTASYQTTIAIAFAGSGAFLWVPLANTYGRRPVMLFTALVAAASSLGSGKAETWGTLIVSRVFNGLAVSSFFTLGAALVSDCFFLHERGRAMGLFTVCLTNSANIAYIPGGFLGQYVSYRWCYYLPGICDITLFAIMLFCLPETLYHRGSTTVETKRPILKRMRLWGYHQKGHHLRVVDFLRPFEMLLYPSVSVLAVYYAFLFTISSILPAVTSASIFTELYNFTASQVGLALGVGTLIGTTLGEMLGGTVVDRTMYIHRKRHPDAEIVPEVKLHGIWAGAALQPIGLLIWGFTINYHTPWIGPTMGFSIMSFALQIVTTVVYSYATDCYKPQTSEISQIFNFIRQTLGMTVGFWAITGGENLGYHLFSVMLALIGLVLFVPVVWLMFKGKAARLRLGQPISTRK